MKAHKKANPEFRYPEEVPERYNWTDRAIDKFLAVSKLAYFKCTGDGNVQQITPFEAAKEDHKFVVKIYVDRAKVTGYDYTGLTRYVGFKDD